MKIIHFGTNKIEDDYSFGVQRSFLHSCKCKLFEVHDNIALVIVAANTEYRQQAESVAFTIYMELSDACT